MDNLITRDHLSDKQIRAMRRIAQGENASLLIWPSLFEMDLVDNELGDDDEMHDILTQAGWKLLYAIDHPVAV